LLCDPITTDTKSIKGSACRTRNLVPQQASTFVILEEGESAVVEQGSFGTDVVKGHCCGVAIISPEATFRWLFARMVFKKLDANVVCRSCKARVGEDRGNEEDKYIIIHLTTSNIADMVRAGSDNGHKNHEISLCNTSTQQNYY